VGKSVTKFHATTVIDYVTMPEEVFTPYATAIKLRKKYPLQLDAYMDVGK
jgi:hypothetical protein